MSDPKKQQYLKVSEADLQGVVRTQFDSPNPTPAQLERRQRSLAHLSQLGVPFLPSLPVVEDEVAILPRQPEEIAGRCIAIAICAVKGESNDNELVQELTQQFDASVLFSPNEKVFIENAHPTQQELIDHAWSYEVLHVLLWSLGYIDALKPPNELCDVPSDVSTIRDTGGVAGLTKSAEPRSMSELLDAADLYYHLHWSVIQLRIEEKSSDSLDESIIRERHRALNWLIRYLDQKWDYITTDT